ncbi:RNA methyltransferase [Desulfocurvus sp. DL9XJH121]
MASVPSIVLFRPKFPENVGAAARACANMGCTRMIAVAPRNWDQGRAEALATPQGVELLRNMRVEPDLGSALVGFSHVFGTTARVGGWRRGMMSPRAAAAEILAQQRAGGSVAVVFGPEDRGLTNAETEICGHLVTIPTAPEASSLNLAQAVLVVLYECFAAGLEERAEPAPEPSEANLAGHDELEILFANMQEALAAIDYLKQDNSDYWMLPVRRFLTGRPMRRFEFNMLMGICRQVKWVAAKAGRLPSAED